MATRDLHNNVSSNLSLCRTFDAAETANGTGVDTQGFESVLFQFTVGTITTGDTLTVSFQESDDNSTYSAIANGELQGGNQPGALGAGSNSSVVERGYTGNARYVRIAVTANALSTGNTVVSTSGVIVLGHPHHCPQ